MTTQPTVTITRHPNGSCTAALIDGNVSLTIAAGPGSTPALLRAAANALRPYLMPGARLDATNA